MSDDSTTKVRIDGDTFPQDETDWARVDAMSDEELVRNAHEDVDNPPAEDVPPGTFWQVFCPQWVRRRLGMSQQQFADAFGFPVRSLQQWEQGRSAPSQAIQSYLRVIAVEPAIVQRALRRTPPPVAVSTPVGQP